MKVRKERVSRGIIIIFFIILLMLSVFIYATEHNRDYAEEVEFDSPWYGYDWEYVGRNNEKSEVGGPLGISEHYMRLSIKDNKVRIAKSI